MLLKNIILATLAAAVAADPGFTIPEGQPEGVYGVSYDEQGNAVHKRIADPAPHVARAPPTFSAKFHRRADGTVSCGGAKSLNHADTDAANA